MGEGVGYGKHARSDVLDDEWESLEAEEMWPGGRRR